MARRASATRATGLAALASMFGLLPVWLLSGLAVFMFDIGLDERRLGFAVGTFFSASAAVALIGGRVADQIGPRRAITRGLIVTVACLAATGTVVDDWRHVLPLLAVAGAASTVLQPAANLLLAREVPAARQGVAIGLKQAAIPMSTLLAGAAVPVVGSTNGWRPAFWLAAATGLLLVITTHERRTPPNSVLKEPLARLRVSGFGSDFVSLITAAALSVAATTAGSTFLVVHAFRIGMSPELAGLALATASFAIIAIRVTTGWIADRLQSTGLTGMSLLMSLGACGAFAIALGVRDTALVIAAMLMLGAGWGWNALMVLAIVRRYPSATGQATGFMLVALRIGSAVGPAVFGVLATMLSFASAWVMAALLLGIGAALTWRLRHQWDASDVR